MKDKILEMLKTKFDGVSEIILVRIADKGSKTATTEEEAKTFVDGLTIQSVIDSYADSRVTEAQKTAITNYEKRYNLKDGKSITEKQEKEEKEKSEEIPTWGKGFIEATNKSLSEVKELAKALAESNKKITNDLLAIYNEKTQKSRSELLSSAISELSPTQQKAYSRLNLLSMNDEEFNTFLGEVKDEVKAITNEARAAATVTNKPLFAGGNSAEEATPEEVASILKKIK